MTSKLSHKVLSILAYYQIFDYPISAKYIQKLLLCEPEKLNTVLNELVQGNVIEEANGLFATNITNQSITKKSAGAERLQKAQNKIYSRSKLISRFPFVRAVAVSGSVSKGHLGADGDVDFFIITKKDRLWIARTFLVLFKKTFLLNSRKYFCVNYFIDENHLEISEKNIFTAMELATLKPKFNPKLFKLFEEKNQWVYNHYQGNSLRSKNIDQRSTWIIFKLAEKILSGYLGNKIDNYFMKITLKKWQQKFGRMSDEDFNIALKTSKGVSKHHPSNFQKKVLQAHQVNLEKLKLSFSVIENKEVA